MNLRSSLLGTGPILTGLGLLLVLATFAGAAPPAYAQGVYGSGLFELGDGQMSAGQPMVGSADLQASADQSGPDWADLFGPSGKLRDDFPYDEYGNPVGNGVPDYREVWGGVWAGMVVDDLSLGEPTETSALYPGGGVYHASAAAENDLGLAYFYEVRDPQGAYVLYAAFERLGAGVSAIELEISQDHFRLGHGGFGHEAPWAVDGERAVGDLLLTIALDAGPGMTTLAVWNGEFWQQLDQMPGEGCNAAESLCMVANVDLIPAGPWAAELGTPPELAGGLFFELGLNLSAFAADPAGFTSLELRTPQDIAFGYFGEEY